MVAEKSGNQAEWHIREEEEEENNLPQMKPLFFLYVWLNLTRIAGLRKEDLVKHIRKRTIQTGRLFFSSSLNFLFPNQTTQYNAQGSFKLELKLNYQCVQVYIFISFAISCPSIILFSKSAHPDCLSYSVRNAIARL